MWVLFKVSYSNLNIKDLLFLLLCVYAGICSATTPFILLGDVLDCLPLDLCDKIFSFVEENVSTWKSVFKLILFPPLKSTETEDWIIMSVISSLQNSFYTAGKNYLLRMCNGKALIRKTFYLKQNSVSQCSYPFV